MPYEQNLEQLLRGFEPTIRGFFCSRVAPQDVEDLMMETFLRLLVASTKGLELRPQLVKVICRNVFIDHLRWCRRHTVWETELSGARDCRVEWESEVIRRLDVQAVFNQLRLPERQLLQMYLERSMDSKTIADVLGIKPETAKKRLTRLFKKLRELLKNT